MLTSGFGRAAPNDRIAILERRRRDTLCGLSLHAGDITRRARLGPSCSTPSECALGANSPSSEAPAAAARRDAAFRTGRGRDPSRRLPCCAPVFRARRQSSRPSTSLTFSIASQPQLEKRLRLAYDREDPGHVRRRRDGALVTKRQTPPVVFRPPVVKYIIPSGPDFGVGDVERLAVHELRAIGRARCRSRPRASAPCRAAGRATSRPRTGCRKIRAGRRSSCRTPHPPAIRGSRSRVGGNESM